MLDKTSGKNIVGELLNDHNHPCVVTRYAYHMRTNRKIGDAEKEFPRQSREAGLRTAQAFRRETHLSRGPRNTGYTKIDATNHCYREDLEKIAGRDASTTLA